MLIFLNNKIKDFLKPIKKEIKFVGMKMKMKINVYLKNKIKNYLMEI
jgi:hypothetical protein